MSICYIDHGLTRDKDKEYMKIQTVFLYSFQFDGQTGDSIHAALKPVPMQCVHFTAPCMASPLTYVSAHDKRALISALACCSGTDLCLVGPEIAGKLSPKARLFDLLC